MKHENAELRRANEILKTATADSMTQCNRASNLDAGEPWTSAIGYVAVPHPHPQSVATDTELIGDLPQRLPALTKQPHRLNFELRRIRSIDV